MINALYIIGGLSRVGKHEIAERVKGLGKVSRIFSTDDFRPNGNNELAWLNVIDYLMTTKFDSNVLIEGVAINPEKVSGLKLENFFIKRPVFIGYGSKALMDDILNYSEKVRNWMYNEEMKRNRAGSSHRDSMPEELIKSEKLKEQAEKLGYKYFGFTYPPHFEERIRPVIEYLTQD